MKKITITLPEVNDPFVRLERADVLILAMEQLANLWMEDYRVDNPPTEFDISDPIDELSRVLDEQMSGYQYITPEKLLGTVTIEDVGES